MDLAVARLKVRGKCVIQVRQLGVRQATQRLQSRAAPGILDLAENTRSRFVWGELRQPPERKIGKRWCVRRRRIDEAAQRGKHRRPGDGAPLIFEQVSLALDGQIEKRSGELVPRRRRSSGGLTLHQCLRFRQRDRASTGGCFASTMRRAVSSSAASQVALRGRISNDIVFDSMGSTACGVTDSSVTRRDLTASVYIPGLSNVNHSFNSSWTVNGFSP